MNWLFKGYWSGSLFSRAFSFIYQNWVKLNDFDNEIWTKKRRIEANKSNKKVLGHFNAARGMEDVWEEDALVERVLDEGPRDKALPLWHDIDPFQF